MPGPSSIYQAVCVCTRARAHMREPSSTYQAVAVCEVEELYSLIGGLSQLSKEAEAAAGYLNRPQVIRRL